MNVFYTNACPIVAAGEHCHKHQIKMIVEYAQLLSAAHHVIDGDQAMTGIYRKTHANHPSAAWVRQSQRHYDWVWFCAYQLCMDYTARTGKPHATQAILDALAQYPARLPDDGFCEPPVAATDEFKELAALRGAAVAYQRYLVAKFAEWQSRAKPIAVQFTNCPKWA